MVVDTRGTLALEGPMATPIDDMGPLPETHPRETVVRNAELELGDLLLVWKKKHELTRSEQVFLIADSLRMIGYYCVKSERARDNDTANKD